jgi:hypothetical protein
MPVQGAYYRWEWGYGGDDGGSGSVQVNFRPSNALALVALSAASGEGLCSGGITQYRTRDANGSDQDHNLPWSINFGGFPPLARDPNMTSVTAELDLGAHQSGAMTLVVWFT